MPLAFMDRIYLVFLSYDILFHDSDCGDTWAGDGITILKAFNSENKAQDFIAKHNPIVHNAEKESRKQVFPRQKNQQAFFDIFGMDLDTQDHENHTLNYKVMKIE